MPCIAALIPRKAYTQRLVGSRVPVTAARGGGTDLQRDGTHSSDVPYGHVVTADGETADLALRERAAETVDVIGIDNGRLDTHGIEFRGADAAAAIRSAESVPVLILPASIATALTCAAVRVPV